MRRALLALSLLVVCAAPAFALTAAEVLDRMNAEQRAGFVDGLFEGMWQYEANPAKASCMAAWWRDGESARIAVTQAFAARRSEQARRIFKTLVDRVCAHPDAGAPPARFVPVSATQLSSMNRDRSSGYEFAVFEIAMELAPTETIGQCRFHWHDGRARTLLEAYDRFPERPAVVLIKLLLDRACGK